MRLPPRAAGPDGARPGGSGRELAATVQQGENGATLSGTDKTGRIGQFGAGGELACGCISLVGFRYAAPRRGT
jgi:hypothetical protein